MPLGEIDGEPGAFDIVDPSLQRLACLSGHAGDEQGFGAVVRGDESGSLVSSLERRGKQPQCGRDVAAPDLEKPEVLRHRSDPFVQTVCARQFDAAAEIALGCGQTSLIGEQIAAVDEEQALEVDVVRRP